MSDDEGAVSVKITLIELGTWEQIPEPADMISGRTAIQIVNRRAEGIEYRPGLGAGRPNLKFRKDIFWKGLLQYFRAGYPDVILTYKWRVRGYGRNQDAETRLEIMGRLMFSFKDWKISGIIGKLTNHESTSVTWLQ